MVDSRSLVTLVHNQVQHEYTIEKEKENEKNH